MRDFERQRGCLIISRKQRNRCTFVPNLQISRSDFDIVLVFRFKALKVEFEFVDRQQALIDAREEIKVLKQALIKEKASTEVRYFVCSFMVSLRAWLFGFEN